MSLFFPADDGKIRATALRVVGEPNIEGLRDPGKYKVCWYIGISAWVDKILDSKYY